MPYNDKFIIGYEKDYTRLIEAGFDVRLIKKTEKGVYYRVIDVASCVVDITDDSVTYMCSDKDGRRFILSDETGRFMQVEVDKDHNHFPPLTREKPTVPGWYRRVIKNDKRYEFDFVKVDRDEKTEKLRLLSVDGTSDFLDSVGEDFIWSASPEKTSFY